MRHIALSPDGSQIIVSQQGAPSQWIFIDAAALTISGRAMAPADQNARRALFWPDGKQAFLVAGTDSTTAPPAVLHIAETATRRIIGGVDLPERTLINDLAVTPDGALLIGGGFQFLHTIDLRTASYGGRISVARALTDPCGAIFGRFQRILMDPSGERFYAGTIEYPSENRSVVDVFDTRSIDQIGEMTVQEPSSIGNSLMRLSPSGLTLVYAAQLGTVIHVFDTSSATEVRAIPVEASLRLSTLVVD